MPGAFSPKRLVAQGPPRMWSGRSPLRGFPFPVSRGAFPGPGPLAHRSARGQTLPITNASNYLTRLSRKCYGAGRSPGDPGPPTGVCQAETLAIIARCLHLASDAGMAALVLFDRGHACCEGLLSRVRRPPQMRSVVAPVPRSDLRADLHLPGDAETTAGFPWTPGGGSRGGAGTSRGGCGRRQAIGSATRKARQQLGMVPHIGLAEGVAVTVKWFREAGWL